MGSKKIKHTLRDDVRLLQKALIQMHEDLEFMKSTMSLVIAVCNIFKERGVVTQEDIDEHRRKLREKLQQEKGVINSIKDQIHAPTKGLESP